MEAPYWIGLLSFGFTAGSAIILIACERLWPYVKKQKVLREGFITDLLFYTALQSYVLGLIIAALISVIDEHTPMERWSSIRSMPLLLQVAIFFVVHDFYIYWFHRWQHANPILWRLHEAHHSTMDVDWLSGSRSHSLEIIINQSIEFAPIVLLAAPEVAVMKGAIDAVWGMYIHSNIDVRSGWLQYVVNGPEMHRWHHANQAEAHNKNFATKLAAWDWLFGTAYLPAQRKPTSYGLMEDYPTNYFKQHAYAFRRTTRRSV